MTLCTDREFAVLLRGLKEAHTFYRRTRMKPRTESAEKKRLMDGSDRIGNRRPDQLLSQCAPRRHVAIGHRRQVDNLLPHRSR
ncbi:hypothetical protein IQ07DRAFT_593656 [Pyrenochaeta sp. DS3sAY3a]|nr:hypothetical protein IQ07DRAFT_593656 [Pyrenochaeta sp. DS3sAY3a]